jgi:hypothetical protein
VLRGSRLPQARNVPQYDYSTGSIAVELAQAAGLTLDPWQADFLADALREDEDGRWAAFEAACIVSRQNGKGSILEARVLAGLQLFGEKMILWSAHETKTAFEAFRRVEQLFTEIDDFRRRVKTIHRSNGSEGIELLDGSRLRFVARTKGSGRGFSADLVILDEAYALTGDQMSALIPTLASRANPQIWYTSSPPLSGDTGDQLFALRKRAKSGDENLCWYDWGLQDVDLTELSEMDSDERDAILDDRNNWAATNPAAGIRITGDFIARERATLDPLDFARERLGVWPRKIEAGAGIIDGDLWRELARPGAARPAELVFAADVNPQRTHACIVAAGPDDEGNMMTQVIDYRPGTYWVVDRLAELKERWDPVAIALDVKSPIGSLILDLEAAGMTAPEDKERPRRGELAIPTSSEVAAAFGLWVDTVRQRRLRHLDEGPLNLALAGALIRPLGGGSTWDHKSPVDISPLRASTLAVWAYLAREHLARGANYNLMNSFY